MARLKDSHHSKEKLFLATAFGHGNKNIHQAQKAWFKMKLLKLLEILFLSFSL